MGEGCGRDEDTGGGREEEEEETKEKERDDRVGSFGHSLGRHQPQGRNAKYERGRVGGGTGPSDGGAEAME